MTEIAPKNPLSETEDILKNFFDNTDVVLFGLSGVGKTTLVRHLQAIIPIRYISLGEITRSLIEYEDNSMTADMQTHRKT